VSISTSQARSLWAPACNTGNLRKVFLNGQGVVSVDARVVDATNWLSSMFAKHGYLTRHGDTGAYNCRRITGGTGYSLHAFGTAIDVNWGTNPYMKSGRLVTDMPTVMISEIQGLRTVNGKRVWEWGGGWAGPKDAMHFEIDCSPADLATGIVNPNVQVVYPVDPAPVDWAALRAYLQANRDAMGSFGTLRQGEANVIQVAVLQACINAVSGRNLKVDGDWGPATMQAVLDLQTWFKLAVDGVVGDATRFVLCILMDKILHG
jgi:hypothetical protein